MGKDETQILPAKQSGRFIEMKKGLKRGRIMYLLLLIPILWYITFAYLPMSGVLIAFQDFNLYKGVFHSKFIGFDHFVKVLTEPYFWHIFLNTFLLGSLTMLFGFPAPIILALLFNEIKDGLFKKIVQTVSYLPYFVSIVAIVNITLILLSPQLGVINGLLAYLGFEKIYFITEPAWFRPIYVILNLWISTGWTSIIYLAAMTGIDTQLYDAAEVDGAGRLAKIWHITLPGISSTIIILLLVNLPNIINANYELALLLQLPITFNTSDIIGTYVYRRGVLNGEFDYATAVGLIFSFFFMSIIYIANKVARKHSETSLW